MTDEEAVYLHLQRQIRFSFIGAVEHHRRMMERGQVKPAEVDIIVRMLIGDSYPFCQ